VPAVARLLEIYTPHTNNHQARRLFYLLVAVPKFPAGVPRRARATLWTVTSRFSITGALWITLQGVARARRGTPAGNLHSVYKQPASEKVVLSSGCGSEISSRRATAGTRYALDGYKSVFNNWRAMDYASGRKRVPAVARLLEIYTPYTNNQQAKRLFYLLVAVPKFPAGVPRRARATL